MKSMMLLIAGMLPLAPSSAQIAVTAATLTYTQDFNSLDSAGTALTAMPAGWSFYEWGGASADATYRASTGSTTSGNTYSFGLSGTAERSLGSLCSGGVPNVSYGARFVNLTGAFINGVTITYKAEQWRRNGSGNIDSVRFYYSTSAGKVIADTALGTWTQVPSLLMTSVTTALPAAATNGNDTAKLITATMPIALPAGDTFSIRWHDYNAAGNDDALSVDSLTIHFNIGPPPAPSKPAVISRSPAPGATNVGTASSLVITFDRSVTAGSSGNIYIKNRQAQSTQTIAAASGNVTVMGRVATISGLGLQPGKTYHVTFDSTAFDTDGNYSYGLYDTAGWQFATMAVGVYVMQVGALAFTVLSPASNGTFVMRCTLSRDVLLHAELYDGAGRKVFDRTYNASSGENLFLMQTALPAGLYFLRISDGRNEGRIKVVMQ